MEKIEVDSDVIELLRYSHLTPFQKKCICNGCGGKGGFINPPEFLFHASCNQHDFYYWRGGSEEDRKIADDAFYKFMKKDVADAHWIKRPFHKLTSWLYYKSVRLMGKKFFNYTDTPKTQQDAEELALNEKNKIRETRKSENGIN